LPASFTRVRRTAAYGNLPLGGIPFRPEQKLITRRLREALELLDERVLDHPIVAGSDVATLAESEVLQGLRPLFRFADLGNSCSSVIG